MKTVELGSTGIHASALGFGCASVMGSSGRRDSLAALEAAWDSGITLYDTARSYGYGESEALLGEFLKGRRDRAVISTKFGILAAHQPLWKKLAKPVARFALSLAPSARSAIRKQAGKEFTPNQFTTAVLEASLNESLRKLRTDYVDLLFMHSAPASVMEQEDLMAALEKLVRAGKVRSAGISAEPEVISETLVRNPQVLTALQFPCNIFDLSAAKALSGSGAQRFATLANHPFGGALRVQAGRQALSQIAGDGSVPVNLREKLTPLDDLTLADVVLNVILSGTGIQVVVPAMMKVPHLKKNVEAVSKSRFTAEELIWLRDKIGSFAAAG